MWSCVSRSASHHYSCVPAPRMKLAGLIISTLLVLLKSHSSAAVTVSTSKPRVEVRENEDAVLSCIFKTEKDDHPRIEWKRNAKELSFVYFGGQFKGNLAGRAKIEGATVTLYKATLKDAGVYRCEVSAPLDSVTLGETNITLKVLVPPHTPSCEIPSNVLAGAAVELHCKDKLSFPPATYKWYKDNKPLSTAKLPNISYSMDTHSGTLHFKSVSRTDSGQYRCESSNGVGAPKSCEAKRMKIDEVDIILVAAAGGGAFLVICLCILGICCACRRGCCKKDKRRGNRSSHSSPPRHPRDFKHTQSFML
ncbi:hypothetical protein MATL_G00177690 [Megalops atlanticus]|uniref:Ig-like domain-containing protein n=1 Tax=Megalops atlanticus TaxID=7932 RepID=A0A9D3PM44_MEGAT|nr:hypothetical protein MATL_G00177690 [Megalops atlanticus]